MPSNPPQNFKNHAKLDPPFHFLMAPVMLINFIVSIVHLVRQPSLGAGWGVIFAAALLMAIFKIRVYALKVQNRLIRLEERLRLSALAPASVQTVIPALTEGQYIALRFASDAEAPGLAARAVAESMQPKEIKAAISVWRPDYYRV